MRTRAHACSSCGGDLSKEASQDAPSLGLRVIVCPICRAAIVRRLHPTIAGWRLVRGWWSALLTLMAQAVSVTLTIGGTVTAVRFVAGDLERFVQSVIGTETDTRGRVQGEVAVDVHPWQWLLTVGLLRLMPLICVSVLGGAWAGAGLAHWRRSRAILFWGAMVMAGLIFEPLTRQIFWSGATFLGIGTEIMPPDWELFKSDALVALVAMVLACAGLPLGAAIRRAVRERHRRRWLVLLGKRKRARAQ